MKKLLLALGLVGALMTSGAQAAVVGSLGTDPTSSSGNFSATVGGGAGTAFQDFWLFNLIGGPAFVTLASATNVFPGGSSSSDFITGFTGRVFQELGATPDPTTDTLVLGPATASPCQIAPTQCQVLSGSAILNPGNFYLDISGVNGGTSGYGGNLAVSAVPLPPALQLFAGALALLGAFLFISRKARSSSAFAAA